MVIVDKDYIVDIDSMNYTAKMKKIATNKSTGEQYEAYETVGYYSNLQSALQGILKHKVTNSLMSEEKSLDEALKCIQACHREFIDMLERVVDDGK